MFLFVGRFVLEFNHSAPHGSQLPTTQPHSSESSKIEQNLSNFEQTYFISFT